MKVAQSFYSHSAVYPAHYLLRQIVVYHYARLILALEFLLEMRHCEYKHARPGPAIYDAAQKKENNRHTFSQSEALLRNR